MLYTCNKNLSTIDYKESYKYKFWNKITFTLKNLAGKPASLQWHAIKRQAAGLQLLNCIWSANCTQPGKRKTNCNFSWTENRGFKIETEISTLTIEPGPRRDLRPVQGYQRFTIPNFKPLMHNTKLTSGQVQETVWKLLKKTDVGVACLAMKSYYKGGFKTFACC